MKLEFFQNREPLPDTVKPGDVLKGICICPAGDWPHGETVQHVTEASMAEMVANAGAEILVDFDHNAEEGGSTQAAAQPTRMTRRGLRVYGRDGVPSPSAQPTRMTRRGLRVYGRDGVPSPSAYPNAPPPGTVTCPA